MTLSSTQTWFNVNDFVLQQSQIFKIKFPITQCSWLIQAAIITQGLTCPSELKGKEH